MSAHMIVKKRGFSAYYYPKYWFNRVEQCNLGTIVTGYNVIAKEIVARVQAGNKCYYGQPNILGSRLLSRKLKKRLYITLICRVVFYKMKI